MNKIKSLAAGLFIYGIIAAMALMVAVARTAPNPPASSTTAPMASGGGMASPTG